MIRVVTIPLMWTGTQMDPNGRDDDDDDGSCGGGS